MLSDVCATCAGSKADTSRKHHSPLVHMRQSLVGVTQCIALCGNRCIPYQHNAACKCTAAVLMYAELYCKDDQTDACDAAEPRHGPMLLRRPTHQKRPALNHITNNDLETHKHTAALLGLSHVQPPPVSKNLPHSGHAFATPHSVPS